LEAEETDLYVDWQRDVAPDDVKTLLEQAIRRSSPEAYMSSLFTGHRGVGKTTELKRLKRLLERTGREDRVFVSFLSAARCMAPEEDIAPQDIVINIARQLVTDLEAQGMSFTGSRVKQFFEEIGEVLGRKVDLSDLKLKFGTDEMGAEIGFVLQRAPALRPVLRELLTERQATLYDLINEVILTPATAWLKERGYGKILVIVDELDRVSPKPAPNGRATYQEFVFLQNASVLRSLRCDTLYTVPIDLAWSSQRTSLVESYGVQQIHLLPVIPVRTRDGADDIRGLDALCQIINRRARQAETEANDLFRNPEVLRRLAGLSGGYLRNLFRVLRSIIDRSEGLPLEEPAVQRAVRRQAVELGVTLAAKPRHREVLQHVHTTKQAIDDSDLWNELLKYQYVFPYEDEAGIWYDWNPLLGEVMQ
jgi:DNA polymerase III delta prime subunit